MKILKILYFNGKTKLNGFALFLKLFIFKKYIDFSTFHSLIVKYNDYYENQ